MVVVDLLTKYVLFFSLSHAFKVNIVAEEFIKIVQNLHGILNIIVSDKDIIFIGNLWTKSFSCLGT